MPKVDWQDAVLPQLVRVRVRMQKRVALWLVRELHLPHPCQYVA